MIKDQQNDLNYEEDTDGDVDFVHPLNENTADAILEMAYHLYKTIGHVLDQSRFPIRTPRDISVNELTFRRLQRRMTDNAPF